jgi:hypothetical protein
MPAMSERERDTQEPHDVLAAEEFGIGTRDERVPPDPTGIHEPHDVLAAEEFAMPVGDPPEYSAGGLQPRTLIPSVLLGAAIAYLLLRLLRD